jgi:Glycosyl hydrolase family 10
MKGFAVNHGWIRLTVLVVSLIACGAPARAQMLAGPWVDESDKRIDVVRKTDLRVIVMGAGGRPVAGVEVRIEQVSGAFHVGVVLPETGWPSAAGGVDTDDEFWRCVNAVSLERMTGWPGMQPAIGSSLNYDAATLIDQTLDKAETRGMFVRWGSLVSADPGRVPPWVANISGRALADAASGYCDLVWDRYGGRIGQYDVYTETLGHSFIESKAGLSVIRRLYEALPADSAGAAAGVRFDDGLIFGRVQQMQRQLTAMREAFIPVGIVAIDQHFGGTVERPTLERMMTRVDQIGRPVVISGLSVGGDSELNAAINLETVLRTMMERENIRGIWFRDLTAEEAIDRTSALLDDEGRPTPSGRLVDSLFHGLWRTNVAAKTDELGNVRVRAFPGRYNVVATLADGAVLKTSLMLEKSDDPRVVLLEPLRAGAVISGDGQ